MILLIALYSYLSFPFFMVCSKFKYFLYIVLLRYNWYTINWIYLKCSMWSILTYHWNSTTIKITNIFIAFRSFSHSFPTHYTSVISLSDFFSFSMIILILSILLHVSMFLFLLLSSFPLCESRSREERRVSWGSWPWHLASAYWGSPALQVSTLPSCSKDRWMREFTRRTKG